MIPKKTSVPGYQAGGVVAGVRADQKISDYAFSATPSVEVRAVYLSGVQPILYVYVDHVNPRQRPVHRAWSFAEHVPRLRLRYVTVLIAQPCIRLHTSFRACCSEAPQLTPSTDFIIRFIELPQFIHRDGIPHNASLKKLTIGSLKMYPKKGTLKK